MKEYKFDSQKGKIIRMMILQWDRFYEDFELEQFQNIFLWNNSWSRLSELLKDLVVEVEYFENPKINPYNWCHCYHRAKYRLKPEYIEFYKKLYEIENIKTVLESFEHKEKSFIEKLKDFIF